MIKIDEIREIGKMYESLESSQKKLKIEEIREINKMLNDLDFAESELKKLKDSDRVRRVQGLKKRFINAVEYLSEKTPMSDIIANFRSLVNMSKQGIGARKKAIKNGVNRRRFRDVERDIKEVWELKIKGKRDEALKLFNKIKENIRLIQV